MNKTEQPGYKNDSARKDKRKLKNNRIKINVTPKVESREDEPRPMVTSIHITGAFLGVAWTQATKRRVRCVRFRYMGICRYVLLGFDRGRVLPVMRNFIKIRQLTDSEEKRILIQSKVWDQLM